MRRCDRFDRDTGSSTSPEVELEVRVAQPHGGVWNEGGELARIRGSCGSTPRIRAR